MARSTHATGRDRCAACGDMTMLLTAQERDRAKVADTFKWNLADVYPDEAAWRAAEGRDRRRAADAAGVRGHARLLGRRRWPTRSS